MTSLRDLSDAELEAIANDDHEGFTRAAAQRMGVRPELALAVRSQESRGNSNAVSPKGARGQMQLMPGTAAELGVDINDPYQNIEGGVRYLRQQHDTFGDEDLALAAYNAGPGAVKKYGGIPPYKETQDYVRGVRGRDISQASDEELLAIAGEGDAPPEVTVQVEGRPDLGVGVAHAPGKEPPPRPAQRAPVVPQRLPQRQGPTIAQDAVSGALQPLQDLGHTVMEGYRSTEGGKPLDPLFIPKLAGSSLNLATTALMPFIRPSVRALNRGAESAGLSPHEFAWNPAQPFRKLEGEEAQRKTEGDVLTALSAAKPATPRPAAAPKAKPMSVDDLRAAKSAAYDAVENMGVAYAPKATAKLADDLGYELATLKINPKVTPKAHAMMEDVQATLRSGNPVTLTELDQLRQAVWRATGKADDAEQFMGGKITKAIDDFMDSAGPQHAVNGDAPAAAEAMRRARELNKRYRKVQTVENEVDSAALRASSTYAGGNKANAIRQELRPLIDKTSKKRIQNFTKAEEKALKKVVEGSGAANAWRVTGKMLDPRGLLGMAMQAGGILPTGGLSLASVPLGMFGSAMSNRATMKSVDQLLKLLSTGPKPKAPPPVKPMLYLAGRPPVPIRSPAGITGASVVGAPLARLPSERPAQKTSASARKQSRR